MTAKIIIVIVLLLSAAACQMNSPAAPAAATPTASPATAAALSPTVPSLLTANTGPSTASPTPIRAAAASPTPGRGTPSATPFRTPTITLTPLPSIALQNPPVQAPQVRTVQDRLLQLGYRELGTASGIYNRQTEIAVQHFQFLNGLPVTGVVDQATYTRLQDPKAAAFSLPPPFSGRILRRGLQLDMEFESPLFIRLTGLGYLAPDSPEIPFTFGPQTEAAVRAFQQAHSLTASGEVNLSVWEALFSPFAAPAGKPIPTSPPAWQTSIFPVGLKPTHLALAGSRLWVVHSNSTLMFIELSTGHVHGPIHIGQLGEKAFKTTPAGAAVVGRILWVYALTPGGQLLHGFDTQTGLTYAVTHINDCLDCFPAHAFGCDGRNIWVGGDNEQVKAVNPATGAVITTRRVGWLVNGEMAYDGRCMWVAQIDGSLTAAFDPGTGLCRPLKDPQVVPAGQLAASKTSLWVVASGGVEWFNPQTGFRYGGIDPGAAVTALGYDGTRLWLAAGQSVWPVLPDSGQLGQPLPVGPQTNALLSDGKTLWAASAAGAVWQMDLSGVVHPSPLPATPTLTATARPTATATATPPLLTRQLSLTSPPMTGADIRLLQQRLVELGYTSVGTPDGVFGSKTDEAVRQFQTLSGLEADGIIGPVTWKAIFSSSAVRIK